MIHVRRGDRLGPLRDGADHAWRERPLRRWAHPQCRRADESRRPPPFPPPQAGEGWGWGGGGPMGPPTLFTIPVLRYMKTYGLTHEQLAMVSVVQREWAAKNPRATFKTPITVEDVLNSRMIAYPFRLLQCCLVTDGGGALTLFSAESAKDFPQKPVYLLATRRECRNPDGQPDAGFHLLARVPRRRRQGLCRGRHHPQRRRPPDDLRRLRPPADLRPRRPRLCAARRGRRLYRGHNTAPGGKLPLNTNGGGLSYMHSGIYGMYALQESVRQMRGTAPAQILDARISVCHGVGGMFAASGTIIMSNEVP
jgi:acetyl-CoA acetyltransferase